MNISSVTDYDVLEISKWRYKDPYSIYNSNDSPAGVAEFMNGNYYAVKDGKDNIIGYYCFGESAQVPAAKTAGLYETSAIDIGLGMRPDLTGNGYGLAFFKSGIDFCIKQFDPSVIRLSVAAFNQRAITVYQRAGFVNGASFVNDNVDFMIMTYDTAK